ncbi:alpha 1 (V) collagen [Pseudonocardia sp. Ae168_Ps1]|uniref:LytR C-terminal domain-containing protein n=1 Tax=unclassified Pseudonocardia TaxID=2619320 RepID=UPI00094AF3EB|nr:MULTISPECIES: LytR C-terminal domain-containing protein [unclassified Pseudonocardia]OLL74543.1 alpha 1 (V) collagen [Pseudonocardia sp. Ae150A_Ps1]OLL80523.1 alpha 1 (V) collagen [Pseudonocardia sp. Ae168_Ps1]OLL85349.1 alpha 1 (V) collagen [Pseudonocardia sp. Ae263_Ps1]OLL94624.1 alpha 1 (V) collagen [Pseudonocardia sp. Ae356_Ps1]
MTAPASGGQSPLKIAGIALIGVGVVAGVVGLFGLGGGGEENPQAAPPPSASAEPAPGGDGAAPAPGEEGGAPAPGQDGAAPGAGAPGTPGGPGAPGAPGGTSPLTPGAPGTPGSPGYDGPGPAVAPPPAAAGGAGGAGGGGAAAGEGSSAAARPAVRIYNNSTIRGLAEKAAGQFRTNGWDVAQVQNYSEGVIPTTTVYYRQGTGEKAAAEEIAQKFGMRTEPRFDGIQDATPGVIVIVTRDFSAA